ncbi:MAG: hypothetical protein IKZ34_03060 [Alphaproteobacteria bacterium]|nr:hypothetical protein [Alphaproteobacteria bacterium]
MLRLIDKSLFKAVRSGTVDVDFIMFLLKSGASPDCQNEFGRCPLLEMLTFVITEIGMEDFILSYPNVLKAAEILAENMKGEPKLTHFFVDLQQKYNRACKNREKLEEFEAEFEEQVNKIIDMLESKQDKTNVNLVNNKSSIVITEEYVKKCLENGEVSYSQKYDLFLAVLRDNGISENCLQILLDSGVRPEPDLLVRELFAKAHNQVRVDSRSKYVEYVNLSIKKLEYLVDKKLVDIDAVLLSHQGSFDDCSYSDFEYGYSAIMLAMKYGWIDIVKMLKAKGANLNIVADDGYVIADLLQSDEFEEKIEDLKQHEVVDKKQENNNTAAEGEVKEGRIKYDWYNPANQRRGQDLPMSQLVTQIVHDWVDSNNITDFKKIDDAFNDIRRPKDGKLGYWRDVVVEMDGNPDVSVYPHRFDMSNPIVLNGVRYVVNISWGTVTGARRAKIRDCWGAFLDRVQELGYNVTMCTGDIRRMLNTIGRTWFVSYAYYIYVDSTHKNWELRPSYTDVAKNYFEKLKREHFAILRDIIDNSQEQRLGTNDINLTGAEIKQMAQEILDKKTV